tara:strand:+ start:32 stop:748 length:717 start_codon:yes stop_codon:yes gene_type:complete
MPTRICCNVSSVGYLNKDTRKIILDLPRGKTLCFKAGQYLEIILPNNRYPFSIANPPHQNKTLELHIRPTPQSKDSLEIEKLFNQSKDIYIEAPMGKCFLEDSPKESLLLIAASTGVTQMKSIFEYLRHIGHVGDVFLYWGVLSESDLYLDELCKSWEDENKNFRYIPVISEPETSPNWQGRTGLVSDAVLQDFKTLQDLLIYVSGGPDMVYATRDAFKPRGLIEKNMLSDMFSYSPR